MLEAEQRQQSTSRGNLLILIPFSENLILFFPYSAREHMYLLEQSKQSLNSQRND